MFFILFVNIENQSFLLLNSCKINKKKDKFQKKTSKTTFLDLFLSFSMLFENELTLL